MSRASDVRLSCIVMTTPEHPQAGVRAAPHLLDRLEQVVGALEREIRRLDRDQQVRRRHQRIDRQQPERRRTVDDDVRRSCSRIGSSRSFSRKCASISPTSLASSLASAIRAGAIAQVRDRRRQDDVRQRAARRRRSRRTRCASTCAHVEKRHRAVGLGIEIDEQRRLAAQRQRRRQVDGGRGLAHAALLVGDGDNHERAASRERTRWRAILGTARCAVGVKRRQRSDARADRRARPTSCICPVPRDPGSRATSAGAPSRPSRGVKSTVLAFSMTDSSTKIGARARSASAIASLGRASIGHGVAVAPSGRSARRRCSP